MKIIFVGGYKIPAQGGIENYILNLASQLSKKGHYVHVISRGEISLSFVTEGVAITQLKVKENALSILKHNILASWYLFRHAADADVVNYQSIFLPFLYEWLPKIKGLKVVHTQHSFAQDNPKYGKKLRWIIGALYRISGIIFSPIITVSEYNKSLINQRLNKRAKVINCGVDLPIANNKTSVLDSLGLNEGRYYLTIGRIDPVKNLHILITAFLKRKCNQNYNLVICGNMNNPYGEYLRSLAKDDKRIIFPGPVSGDIKNHLLTSCFAYCLVSISEGFPIALLEAMAHGNICLCSDIPACKEVLTEPLGLWSPVDDVDSLMNNMMKLENNPQYYEDIKQRVIDRVTNNLTWDKISNQYIEHLQKLFGRDSIQQ